MKQFNPNKRFVSIDFDGTLTRPFVQRFVKQIPDSIELIILTSRFDDNYPIYYPAQVRNHDLWELIEKIGIEREKVYFLNHLNWKADFLCEYSEKLIFHLDDDEMEIEELLKIGLNGIQVKGQNIHSLNLELNAKF